MLGDNISKYKALVDAINYLNSSMKVDEVLNALLEKSVELLDNADTGLIFIYNNDSNLLEVKCSYGFDKTAYQIIIKPSESMTGQTFRENRTIVVNGVTNVQEYMNSISFYNQMGKSADYFLGKRISEIKGVISCPIKVDNVCIGVLVVDNFSNNTDFTNQDVEILEAVSVQAALAITNAQRLEYTEKSRKMLEDYSLIVESEKNKYRYALEIHNKFTNMVLNGASIEELINELSILLKCELLYFDKYKNLIKISNTKYSFLNDTSIEINEIKKNLLKKTITHIEMNGYSMRVQPILIDGDNNGWISMIRSFRSYLNEEEIIIDRALIVLALEIMKKNQMHSVDEKYRGDFIDILISGENEDMFYRYSNQFDIDLSRPCRLLLFEFTEKNNQYKVSSTSKDIEETLSYNQQLISNIIDSHIKYFITTKMNTLFLIIEESSRGREDIELLLNKIFSNNNNNIYLKNDNIKMTAIASQSFLGHHYFGSIYQCIRKLFMELNHNLYNLQWVFYEDYKIKQLLLNNNEKELHSFLMDILGPLLLNSKYNEDFFKTLKMYIQSNDNWSLTKESLFIHGNTLTQRLKRISQILNLSLTDYKDHLSIQIALEIYDLIYLNK